MQSNMPRFHTQPCMSKVYKIVDAMITARHSVQDNRYANSTLQRPLKKID